MLYYLLKFLTNIFYRVFYRFEFRGIHKIPFGKPVVLAPNHVNAFIDPVIIAMLMRRKVRFFARGDVFKKPLAKWILNQLSMSPMYRIQEGYAELKKNDKTFEECRRLLSENKVLLMFPEGICVQERRLRPLKKGLSRIIFQTEESFDFKKDVLVIPIGLNYSDAKRFRSKLYIDCGDPISLKEYEQRYKEDKVRAINEFTKVLEQKMAERLIIIKHPINDALVTALEQIYLNEWMRDKKQDVRDMEVQYNAVREVAAMVNTMEEERPELVASLREKTAAYTEMLDNEGLRDHLLNPDTISNMSIKTFMLESFIIYVGMPVYWFGLLVNYPPYYFSKRVAYKKAKNVEFLASIYMNLTMFLWMFYFGIQLIVVGLIFRNWLLLGIYAAVVIVSGLFVLQFYAKMRKIFGRWRLLKLVRKDRKTVEELVDRRRVIITEIRELKRIFLGVLD